MKNFMLALMLVPIVCFGQNGNFRYDSKNVLISRATNSMVGEGKYILSGAVAFSIDSLKVNCDSAVIDFNHSAIYAYSNITYAAKPGILISTTALQIDIPNFKRIAFEGGMCGSEIVRTTVPFKRIPLMNTK